MVLTVPHLNFLLECLQNYASEITDSGTVSYTQGIVISPGIGLPLHIGSLEIKPGIAFPISISSEDTEYGILFFLSFEHPC